MPRLNREQIKQQERLAWIRSLPEQEHAKASDYVWHVDDFVKEYPNINQGVLACRVSTRQQDKQGNLRRQSKGSRQRYKRHGIGTPYVYKEIGSGSNPLEERTTLLEAIRKAGALQLPLLIPCVSRLLRHLQWKTIDQDRQPTKNQWEELIKLAKEHNVKWIVSLNDPDATPQEDEGFLSTLNKEALGTSHKGRSKHKYPGYRKDQKAQSLNMVKQLHKAGKGCRRIAKAVERLTGYPINRKTILEWVA